VPRQRSVEGVLAEHERYRRQCAKRIPSSLTLLGIVIAGCVYATYRDRSFIWYAVGITLFCAFYAFGEVFAYWRHGKRIRELSGAPTPNTSLERTREG
jgi:hypothetical protein